MSQISRNAEHVPTARTQHNKYKINTYIHIYPQKKKCNNINIFLYVYCCKYFRILKGKVLYITGIPGYVVVGSISLVYCYDIVLSCVLVFPSEYTLHRKGTN